MREHLSNPSGTRDERQTIETDLGVVHHDPTTDRFTVVHDWEADRGLSTTVLSAVQGATETPMERRPSLFDVVDVDAVDRLFAPADDGTERTDLRLSFCYADVSVTVEGDGTVTAYRIGRQRREANATEVHRSIGRAETL